MGQKICIAQFSAGEDKITNIEKIEYLAKLAYLQAAYMLFLPEYSMFYPSSNAKNKILLSAEPLDGHFVTAICRIAKQYHLWILCGFYEKTEILPYNTTLAVNAEGHLVRYYRKQKLFDAFDYRESDECQAGTVPCIPFDTPIGKLGIITCFELRFPELAALQKAAGAEVLFVPAGWMHGDHKKLHWETLLCARAIENNITVLGVNQYHPNRFIGYSCAFSSIGIQLTSLAEGERCKRLTLPVTK